MVNGKWIRSIYHSPFTIHHLLAKDLYNFFDCARKRVNLLLRVVESEGGTRCRGDVETLHDRLCAVVSGTHSDSFLIENRADVVRVNVVNDEREHTCLLARRADNPHAFDPADLFGGIS